MIFYQIALIFLSCSQFLLLLKTRKDKKDMAQNSQVFHPQLTPIWRQAALDWAQSAEDERTFDTFLTDTIDIIMSRGRNG